MAFFFFWKSDRNKEETKKKMLLSKIVNKSRAVENKFPFFPLFLSVTAREIFFHHHHQNSIDAHSPGAWLCPVLRVTLASIPGRIFQETETRN
jgi:hypothetical protein